jgi:hypothetical protein
MDIAHQLSGRPTLRQLSEPLMAVTAVARV